MRRISPKTFFGQLVLGTVLAQTMFLVMFIWYIIVSTRRGSEDRTRDRIVQQLNRLEAACAPALAAGNLKAVHDVLELSRISQTIDVARLTDLSGKTLTVSDNGQDHGLDAAEQGVLAQAGTQQIFAISNGQLEAMTPVLVNGKPVALLWLEPNRARSLNTANTVIRICLSYGGFALLVNLLPIFLIVQRMTRPLNRLREATNRLIRNPDLNAGFPLPVTTSNEAGDLTVSFNSMVLELENQRNGLLETLALLDSMLGNAPIGFAFFDHNLEYVRVNEFLAATHGLPIEDHIGHRALEFYPASLALVKEAKIKEVFETGQAIRDVQLFGDTVQAPGLQRSWLMNFYPVATEEKTIKWVGVVVVEITERLQAEEALRKTEKLAAAGRLAASIAHEINNPLESVTNLLYLLEHHEPLDPVAKEFVMTAQAELARVAEITQQTLRFYRQSTSPTETNIAEVLTSIVALYQPRLNSSRIDVVRKFRGEPEIFGFGGELRQLFANLIGNAVDAMALGGQLYLRVRRSAGVRADGTPTAGVRVTVADTGSGMSAETLQRIFEAFFTTKQATGTGLGLWVSDEIIRKHHGTVRVRSRQSAKSGTSFMIFFPDHTDQDEADMVEKINTVTPATSVLQ